MRKTAVISAYILLISAAQAIAGFNLNIRSNLYSNLIEGSTDFSLLEEGNFNTHDISAGYSRSYERSRIRGSISARATNELYAYRDEFSILRWNLAYEGETDNLAYGIIAGEIYETFSDMVFSRALTGGGGYAEIGNIRISPVYGYQYSAEDDIRYRRDTYGGRVSGELPLGIRAGVSFAHTEDDKDSAEDTQGIIPIEKNTVFGFDLNGNFLDSLDISFSWASSEFFESLEDTKMEDTAYRLRADYRMRNLSLGGEYSLAGSSFSSLSGYADRDREVRSLSAGYRFGRRGNARISYEEYRNNLDEQLSFTTRVRSPRFRGDLRVTDRIIMSLDLRSRSIDSDDAANTVDRYFSSRNLSLRYSAGRANLALGYSLSDNTDKNDATRDYEERGVSLSAGSSFTLMDGDLRVSPSLSFRRSIRERGPWDESEFSSLNISVNGSLSDYFGLRVSHSRNDRDDDLKSRRNSIGGSYFIGGERNRTVEVEYIVFSNESAAGNDYTDKIFRAGLNMRFF